MTPVSIAFRRAMLCTKSELRFRQYSFNHRTRNLRSVEILRLTPYPLYQHAIVPFEFPRQVGWLFPLFTFNNVPLRGRYTFALSSARFGAYYQKLNIRFTCNMPTNGAKMVRKGLGYLITVQGVSELWKEEEIVGRFLDPPIICRSVFTWKREQPFSLAATKFIDHIRENL